MDVKPKKGDVWLVNFSPSREGEIGKDRRPAIVCQRNEASIYLDTVTLVPITSSLEQYNSINIKISPSKFNGLKEESTIVCSHIYTVTIGRLLKKLGNISAAEIKKIEEAIIGHLDLDI